MFFLEFNMNDGSQSIPLFNPATSAELPGVTLFTKNVSNGSGGMGTNISSSSSGSRPSKPLASQ